MIKNWILITIEAVTVAITEEIISVDSTNKSKKHNNGKIHVIETA